MFRTLISALILITLVFTVGMPVFGQGELSDDSRVVTLNENSYSGFVASNGFGVNYRYGKRLDGFRKRLLDFDFAYIKHPKEIRTQNPYYENQKRFVFGKLNTFFLLRTGYGIQKEFFSKYDKGGVAIRGILTGGLTTGLLKPVYYEVVDSTKIQDGRRYIYIGTKRFDNSIHSVADIYGRASFFKGFSEMGFRFGAFVKMAFSFEYSRNFETINALETGVVVDLFSDVVPLMHTEKNERVFISLFVSYRFGRLGEKKTDRTETEESDESFR